ncbi:MAG: proline dehydrogenase family protein [Candidatus Latescibacterota bacterium]|jgi:proline dehydrogenase
MRLPFFLARRFVAAEDFPGTIPIVRDLNSKGLTVTLDLLGEYTSDRSVAAQKTDAYVNLLERISEEKQTDTLKANISIKLSGLGQKIDQELCKANLSRLLETAKEKDIFVRLDMEGSDLTESTISIFESAYPDYPDHVGIVLQAYLHRTTEDVARMCEMNARVRICKGAYKEPASIAYQDMPTIREHFVEHMQKLISDGRYPGIATHDDILINATKRFVEDNAIPNDRYEFQMLYGVRPHTQEEIAADGYRMRVYVPFGTEWLPYYSRRIRERKENLWFVLRNLFKH